MVCRHTAVEFEDKMYVFGGSNIYEEFNDLWELDLLTK